MSTQSDTTSRREPSAEAGVELLDALASMLRETGEDIALDLTGEPSTVVLARTAGRVFAAAWPGDRGLFVRLRLEIPPDVESFQPVGSGSLAYESVITTREQLADLVDLLREAHTLARSGSGGGPGRRIR